MQALQFGSKQRLLFGFHHAAQGAARQTAVLICNTWGLEYMRSYRGVRVLAQKLAAAGFETLRFDYSGTGDSQGHSLDARLEHWLEDLVLAARELRELSGKQDIVVIGLRLGALIAEAARQRPGLNARLHIHWDAPSDGASYIALMRQLSDGSDRAKNWRRNRHSQLPPSDGNELQGHAFPAPLAAALTALPGPAPQAASLWLVSSDHSAPPAVAAESVLALGEAAHWQELDWVNTPWVPAAAAGKLASHLAQVLR